MGNYKTGFILLLVIVFTSNLVPALRPQNTSGTLLAYNRRLYDQHVFSGFWQHQLHQMTVFLQYFNNGGQQISMYDNYFHQRDNYVFPRQQLHYLDIAWYLNIRMATKNNVSFQDTQRELILNTDIA